MNQKLLMFVADEYEDLELHYPRLRMKEAGFQITIAGLKDKETYTGKKGLPCVADIAFESVDVHAFDGLIIPGGYAPDKLRRHQKVLDLTRNFHEQKKVIAFICHAGWIPISAGIIKGVKCTTFHAIKDDMMNAGANWVDAPVVIDQHFVSSRDPDDLPVFCQAIVEQLTLIQR